MMALLLLAAGLQELPPQRLGRGDCALVLWEQATRQRVAMVARSGAEAPTMRLKIDGTETRLPVQSGTTAGEPVMGFTPTAGFAGGAVQASHDIVIDVGPGGRTAAVRSGVLTVRLADGTDLVMPVAGLIGCG
ncbi:hypothetical protein [Polymorphobacter sp.]|uniref:hypothetical protein n=1 Tax=Polymorphobacter sp. TaxID=1909290 RepID=UPI003F71D442